MNLLHSLTLGMGFDINPVHLLIVLVVLLLVFGRRLPEVGRNLGRGLIEFKKGLAGVEDDVNRAAQPGAPQQAQPAQQTQLPPQAASSTMPGTGAQQPQAVAPDATKSHA